jgi:tRNA G10  N-methylase Trm11
MLDPTAGSATSLIVAHRLGATVTGLELDPDMHRQASQHFAQEIQT